MGRRRPDLRPEHALPGPVAGDGPLARLLRRLRDARAARLRGPDRRARRDDVRTASSSSASSSASPASPCAALAGMRKEKELSDAEKKASIAEFSFAKGAWVAVFAGIMSSCMAFAFAAGKPIAEAAVEAGARPIFQNFPVLIVALFGGFTTNFVWCAALSFKNRSWRDYRRVRAADPAGAPGRVRGAGQADAVAPRQLRLVRAGRDDLVLPVLLLRHGHDPDGQVRLLQLDDPHGLHHHLQQPVGDLLPRVEGDREADAPAGRGRDRRSHPVDGRRRGGELPCDAQVASPSSLACAVLAAGPF
ncbi:MAG: hypothetical protein MZU84_06385 [Sphingobacterium sp.]|nr:hypothetical protein [Sphingobacterium sp.]